MFTCSLVGKRSGFCKGSKQNSHTSIQVQSHRKCGHAFGSVPSPAYRIPYRIQTFKSSATPFVLVTSQQETSYLSRKATQSLSRTFLPIHLHIPSMKAPENLAHVYASAKASTSESDAHGPSAMKRGFRTRDKTQTKHRYLEYHNVTARVGLLISEEVTI